MSDPIPPGAVPTERPLPAAAQRRVIARTPVLATVLVVALGLIGALGFAVVHLGSVADSSPLPIVNAAPAPAPAIAPDTPVVTSTRRTSTSAVDPAWAARNGARAGIPVPAMVAYGNAELTLAKDQPACHLAWNTLAGIGWVESQNGTIGGRTLETNGFSSTPVIGPALNGNGFAAIHSTPTSAQWHGDSTWEHAVGPMQFIASTWTTWGTDGDGDGTANPLDINDAALTTGRYLCADSHDLSTVTGWNAAIHSYNHDNAYVADVLTAANTYAQRTTK
ncbi:MAG TPA: lytic murein transglycosylase [Marmoricola sp.]|nr:lytic murein transglycosylase [Marmoricola sp.]